MFESNFSANKETKEGAMNTHTHARRQKTEGRDGSSADFDWSCQVALDFIDVIWKKDSLMMMKNENDDDEGKQVNKFV